MAGVGFSLLMLVYPMSRPDLNIRHEKALDVETGGDNGEDDISSSVSAIIRLMSCRHIT